MGFDSLLGHAYDIFHVSVFHLHNKRISILYIETFLSWFSMENYCTKYNNTLVVEVESYVTGDQPSY